MLWKRLVVADLFRSARPFEAHEERLLREWRSLVRHQGLGDEGAIELMVCMVRCALRE